VGEGTFTTLRFRCLREIVVLPAPRAAKPPRWGKHRGRWLQSDRLISSNLPGRSRGRSSGCASSSRFTGQAPPCGKTPVVRGAGVVERGGAWIRYELSIRRGSGLSRVRAPQRRIRAKSQMAGDSCAAVQGLLGNATIPPAGPPRKKPPGSRAARLLGNRPPGGPVRSSPHALDSVTRYGVPRRRGPGGLAWKPRFRRTRTTQTMRRTLGHKARLTPDERGRADRTNWCHSRAIDRAGWAMTVAGFSTQVINL